MQISSEVAQKDRYLVVTLAVELPTGVELDERMADMISHAVSKAVVVSLREKKPLAGLQPDKALEN
jgi:hypothetical protein